MPTPVYDILDPAYAANQATIDARIAALMPDTGQFALKSDVPSPSTTVPPAVNSTGDQGVSQKFALADHTHKSSMWAGTLPTDANGVAAFSFMTNFFDAPPVISVDIENTDATVLYNRAITSKTKNGVTVTVKKVTTIIAGLLTVSTPAQGLVVNVIARKAST